MKKIFTQTMLVMFVMITTSVQSFGKTNVYISINGGDPYGRPTTQVVMSKPAPPKPAPAPKAKRAHKKAKVAKTRYMNNGTWRHAAAVPPRPVVYRR